jgi:hypothetical protein
MGSVAKKAVRGEYFGCVANKGVIGEHGSGVGGGETG